MSYVIPARIAFGPAKNPTKDPLQPLRQALSWTELAETLPLKIDPEIDPCPVAL
jgi:hypothetical protein